MYIFCHVKIKLAGNLYYTAQCDGNRQNPIKIKLVHSCCTGKFLVRLCQRARLNIVFKRA